ncbi:dirigent protein 22-like [Zingiber officinale]|uniref:dirigent protein 22-like n=1 Tax=Zingiber officinale TaxID=94328 RepID=UPI001C4CDEF9|nr:dirigent protein 22-like [Zingiber officinale]
MAYYCSFKPLLLFLFFLIATTQGRDFITSHLHFFLHENYNSPNATSITVINSTNSNPGDFGSIGIFDDELREGSTVDSKLIGRAQGIAPGVSLRQTTWLVLLNFVFTEGEYNGSSLTVVGRATLEGTTERSIIGGTGKFRMARGYTINTFLISGGPAIHLIAEYDAYIVH